MFYKSIILSLFVFSFNASAGSVQVFWESPENYTDILPAIEKKHTYQAEVFSAFEKHFNKLAKQLPEDKTLYINVKNLDLAGAVTYAYSKRIRVIRDGTPPRIEFSFQLIDSNNQLLVSRSVNLHTSNFKFTRSLKVNKPYYHDLANITEWFEGTFKPIINNS